MPCDYSFGWSCVSSISVSCSYSSYWLYLVLYLGLVGLMRRLRWALISLQPAGSFKALTNAHTSFSSWPSWSCSTFISRSTIGLFSCTLVTPRNGSETLNVGFSGLYIFYPIMCL